MSSCIRPSTGLICHFHISSHTLLSREMDKVTAFSNHWQGFYTSFLHLHCIMTDKNLVCPLISNSACSCMWKRSSFHHQYYLLSEISELANMPHGCKILGSNKEKCLQRMDKFHTKQQRNTSKIQFIVPVDPYMVRIWTFFSYKSMMLTK